jgi:hypothetical protein
MANLANLASIHLILGTIDGGGLAGGASDGDKEDDICYYSDQPSIVWIWRVSLMLGRERSVNEIGVF